MFHLTSNVAYTGQCTKEDNIDYYSMSQPQARNQSEMKDDYLSTDDIAANSKSSQDQISAILYDTIKDTTVDLEALALALALFYYPPNATCNSTG